MDKNQLLEYYSSYYRSRDEILFRLPFSISADSFWQELLNRRKMKSTILPLYNALGKPFWFVMTDKMIKASEILCDEAQKLEEFDPYKSEMTTAMTWEMFFTSFVEGVSLDVDEALDYLSCDVEPSNVQEQLLWNNRQAISTMAANIFRPIDENFLLQLAYLLTQDLDESAEGYRQTDTHAIGAMTGENYNVPYASDIPMRMNEFCAFLSMNGIHPLIKSAVSQAFILSIRPFSSGNERLSRIISTLILYRSGYDYFREISISRKIAQETFLYYKSMRELLNPKNEADMTYFIEYYIELLSRVLIEDREEKLRREKDKAESLIVQEQKMAVMPLSANNTAEATGAFLPTDSAVSTPAEKEEPENPTLDVGDLLSGAETVSDEDDGDDNNGAGEEKEINFEEECALFEREMESKELNSCMQNFLKLKFSTRVNEKRIYKGLIHCILTKKYEIDRSDWQMIFGLTQSPASRDLRKAYELNFVTRRKMKIIGYVFHIDKELIEMAGFQREHTQRNHYSEEELLNQLADKFLDEEFTTPNVSEKLEIPKSSFYRYLQKFLKSGNVICVSQGSPCRYKLADKHKSEENNEIPTQNITMFMPEQEPVNMAVYGY